MTPQQVVAIAIRLCSVWFILAALQAFGMAMSINEYGETSFSASEILIGVYLILAVAFWAFPMAIAHFLVPNTKFENTINLQPYQTVYVACVVLGLWVCVINALPFISTYISLSALVLHQGQALTVINPIENRRFFTGIIQLIVGLALVFRAEFISKNIIKFQSGSSK